MLNQREVCMVFVCVCVFCHTCLVPSHSLESFPGPLCLLCIKDKKHNEHQCEVLNVTAELTAIPAPAKDRTVCRCVSVL